MPEIQYLPAFPAIFILSGSTDIYVHLPTVVGTDDGIYRFDNACTNGEEISMALTDIKVRTAKPSDKWWADFLDVNREKVVSVFDFGTLSNQLK
ncbi:hypothetical protein [Dickeya oryzae]